MDQQTASLLHKIATLEQQMAKQGAAANFVITHMIKLLDEQSGDSQFSSKLRETLSESLDKLNHSQSAPIKSAINELLQPSVQIMFQPKPEKFIKYCKRGLQAALLISSFTTLMTFAAVLWLHLHNIRPYLPQFEQ